MLSVGWMLLEVGSQHIPEVVENFPFVDLLLGGGKIERFLLGFFAFVEAAALPKWLLSFVEAAHVDRLHVDLVVAVVDYR